MAKDKTKMLGRGLGELLGEIEEAYDNEIPRNETVVEIPLSQIRPNPYQPRKHFDEHALHELAASIKTHGLIQPIVLVEDVDGYILVAGERRWRASKLAKLKTIRAIIAVVDQSQMRQHALIENIQREELNVIELAGAYEELITIHGLTHEALSNVVHKSRTHITNTLRLLQLSKKTCTAISDGKISAGHAKVLIGLSEKEQQLAVDSICGQKLSVRETEQMVKSLKNDPKPETPAKKDTAGQMDLEPLVAVLRQIGLSSSASGKRLSITFQNETEAEAFLRQLQK